MSTRSEILALSESQVGYTESGSNITKYSKYFDTTAWQWYNTKKQGAEWCAIYQAWIVCQIIGPERALTFLGCPAPKNNCSAGVKYMWDYLVKKGYKVDPTAGQPGDIIFLNSKKHVGHIVAVENGYYKTIEGNKGNKVARGSYKIGSSTVSGVCHLPFEEFDSEPSPAPQPTPAPAPAPEPPKPSAYNYKVKTNGSPLRLRVAPNTKSAVLCLMPNGAKVKVTATQDGWSRTTYDGKTGWAYSKWLVKI